MASKRARELDLYVRRGHRAVEGWVSPLLFRRIICLDRLQRELGVVGHVGEIGVHHGQLFILLYLLRQAEERAVAIDLFEHQELNTDRSGAGDREIFLANITRWAGTPSAVEIIATDSTAISGQDVTTTVGDRLRLFSVDGGHQRETVTHDLRTASECLVAGGIVMVDDYLNPEFPGVAEATLAFLSSDTTLRPFCVSTQKLYLTTSDYAETYAHALYKAETGRSWSQERRHSFVKGIDSPIRTAELLDCTVVCYSDEVYRRSERLASSIRSLRRQLRHRASDNPVASAIGRGPLGRFAKQIGNKLFPY